MQKLPGNNLCNYYCLCLLFILTILLSCNIFDYEPSNTQLTNVPPPQPSSISIDIAGSSDTLYVWGYVTINYAIRKDSLREAESVSLY